MNIEEQLLDAAQASGLSMLQLSKRASIPYSGIHAFMNGNRSLTLRTAARLARLLNLELRPARRSAKRKG